ncbi:MAG: chemotaxis protein CheW [Salinisphaeraceae bacterium]
MAESDRVLYGQLMPLASGWLLLPKAGLAEVLGMESVALETEGPAWLLGFGEWRDQRLPVLSLEALWGEPMPTRTRRTRVAVINSLGTHLDAGLFMIVLQGKPQLTLLNPAALRPAPAREDDSEVILSRTRLANTDAVIPDLEAIERRLADAVAGVEDRQLAAADWEPGGVS